MSQISQNSEKICIDNFEDTVESVKECASAIVRDSLAALDNYVGQKISAYMLFEIRQVYVSQILARFPRVSLQYLDIGVETENNTQINVYPKNFYTALVMAGFEPPAPPVLQDVFYSGNLKYTMCGRSLACSNI